MPTKPESFERERERNVETIQRDDRFQQLTRDWTRRSWELKYTYQFDWLGMPIIQHPEDIVSMQELIWRTRPDVVVETGVARGGSLVFYASMMTLLGGDGVVIGVDVDIRPHAREGIAAHPLRDRITLVEGSSVDPTVVDSVRRKAGNSKKTLVVLDSNHTHEHVLAELRAYSPLVRTGGYVVVFDTLIDDMPADHFADRPWKPGNSPRSAVQAFLRETKRFELDPTWERKSLITAAPGGFLKCLKD